MNTRVISGFFVLVLGCLSVATAAPPPSPAPPIEASTLQAYTRGPGAIAGTATFFRNGGALCAPDIPYVAWFVNETQLGNHPRYNDLLQPYTQNAQVAMDGTFTCKNLSPGRYLVWLETSPGVPVQVVSLPQHVVVDGGTVTVRFTQM